MSHGLNTLSYFADLLILSIICLPLFYLCPSSLIRRLLLIFLGCISLFIIAPRILVFYMAYWFFVWGLQRLMAISADSKMGLRVLWGSLILILAPMFLWKLMPFEIVTGFNVYGHQFTWLISTHMGEIDAIKSIILPVGLSFASFRAADLIIQTYLGLVNALTLDRLLFFGFFPSCLVIGPVIEYTELGEPLENAKRAEPSDVATGAGEILAGLFKVLVLSLPLAPSAGVFIAPPVSLWRTWLLLFFFAFYFYLNFAGFSNIAIGIARLYGFRLRPNFEYPFFRDTISGFWAGWHMSLTRFCQRNIYMALGGMRKSRQYLALYATMITIGLWHDLSLPFVIFGCWHATGLMIERKMKERFGSKENPVLLTRVFRTFGVFVFVALSLPLVMLPLSDLPKFYAALVGL